MAAAKLNLEIDQGETFSKTFTFRNPPVSPATVGDPVDLTGNSFEGKIRKNVSDTAVVAVFTCTLLDQILQRGKFTVSLTHVQTSAIVLKSQKGSVRTPEPFAYDIERTFPDGSKKRILEGVALISPEVTK